MSKNKRQVPERWYIEFYNNASSQVFVYGNGGRQWMQSGNVNLYVSHDVAVMAMEEMDVALIPPYFTARVRPWHGPTS